MLEFGADVNAVDGKMKLPLNYVEEKIKKYPKD